MKNLKRSFCATVVIVMVLLSSMQVSFAYTAPNLSSTAYTTGNIFYNSGYSGQCTWFAWGRTKEVLGISLNSQFYGNANTWWFNNTTYPTGQTATANCLAIFNNGTAGHVVYVEYVSGDTIYFNEANFHRTGAYDGALESQTTANFKARSGAGTFLGFIYLQSSTTSVIVDDGDSGFYKYGPASYWHSQAIGYGGDMIWTYANGNTVSNYCQWKPTLAGAGNYKVEIYVPNNYATTSYAKYTIKANGGTYSSTVNQNAYYDAWITLGTYYFNSSNNGSEYVELTDATGETTTMIGFDAVRFTKQ